MKLPGLRDANCDESVLYDCQNALLTCDPGRGDRVQGVNACHADG